MYTDPDVYMYSRLVPMPAKGNHYNCHPFNKGPLPATGYTPSPFCQFSDQRDQTQVVRKSQMVILAISVLWGNPCCTCPGQSFPDPIAARGDHNSE